MSCSCSHLAASQECYSRTCSTRVHLTACHCVRTAGAAAAEPWQKSHAHCVCLALHHTHFLHAVCLSMLALRPLTPTCSVLDVHLCQPLPLARYSHSAPCICSARLCLAARGAHFPAPAQPAAVLELHRGHARHQPRRQHHRWTPCAHV